MKNIFSIEKDYDPSIMIMMDPKTKKPVDGADSWDEDLDTDWDEDEEPAEGD